MHWKVRFQGPSLSELGILIYWLKKQRPIPIHASSPPDPPLSLSTRLQQDYLQHALIEVADIRTIEQIQISVSQFMANTDCCTELRHGNNKSHKTHLEHQWASIGNQIAWPIQETEEKYGIHQPLHPHGKEISQSSTLQWISAPFCNILLLKP